MARSIKGKGAFHWSRAERSTADSWPAPVPVKTNPCTPAWSSAGISAAGGSTQPCRIATCGHEDESVRAAKGTRGAPQCGFSNMACEILNFHGVEYASRDVLSSDELRNGIKEFTSWPTIPQVFIDGEFVGGCDILRQMLQDGELEKALKANANK